jgi:hypothetical protein
MGTAMKKENNQRLFREINVWKRIDDTTLLRYRCLHVMAEDRYYVKSSDFYYWPLDKEQIIQRDFYFLDSLFGEALEPITEETYETVEEAILMHDKEFADFKTD